MSWVEELNAVTLATADMAASVDFYDTLGFDLVVGGPEAAFTTYRAGRSFLNVQLDPAWVPSDRVWGRAIFWVDDVDAVHDRAVRAGFEPEADPADAPWGERFFHLRDPAGHELSFARRLDR